MGEEQERRDRLAHLYDCGIRDAKKLAKMVSYHIKTTRKLLKKLENGKKLVRKAGSGASPTLSGHDHQRLFQLAIKNDRLFNKRLATEVEKRVTQNQ